MTGTELFFGFDLVIDESIAPGDFKIMHADGSAQVFRINPDESVTEMVVNPIGRVFDPETPQGRFWLESARQKKLEEEAAKAGTPLKHFEAMMHLSWAQDNLAASIRDEPIRLGPQDLDEWLAEDSWMPEVMEALL